MVLLLDIVSRIARDADEIREGFQPTPLYVALCILIPLVMGVLAGLLSSAVMSIHNRARTGRNGDDGGRD